MALTLFWFRNKKNGKKDKVKDLLSKSEKDMLSTR